MSPAADSAPSTAVRPTKRFALPPALARQVGADLWSADGLLEALAASLPPDFPAIEFAGEEICARGVYRRVSRIRGGTAVRIDHPRGAHAFAPVEGGAQHAGWQRHFSRHASTDPIRDASRLCCSELVSLLESFADHRRDDWIKVIDQSAWTLVPLDSECAKELGGAAM